MSRPSPQRLGVHLLILAPPPFISDYPWEQVDIINHVSRRPLSFSRPPGARF